MTFVRSYRIARLMRVIRAYKWRTVYCEWMYFRELEQDDDSLFDMMPRGMAGDNADEESFMGLNAQSARRLYSVAHADYVHRDDTPPSFAEPHDEYSRQIEGIDLQTRDATAPKAGHKPPYSSSSTKAIKLDRSRLKKSWRNRVVLRGRRSKRLRHQISGRPRWQSQSD